MKQIDFEHKAITEIETDSEVKTCMEGKIGIGDKHCKLAVYSANRPPLEEYLERESLIPAAEEELAMIARETGNHWRKIINIYAKLAYMLNTQQFSTWQCYRDTFLLTRKSQQALLFNNSIVTSKTETISIICGKTHAMSLLDNKTLNWIDDNFAINPTLRVIVTPYFDYRQLSNIKLEKLVEIINSLN